uniref:Nucleolar complex protein 3 homolog n=1 Tax=Tetraodon nigroviridis TaxID=99883 RepID=H3DMG8_TETNG
RSKKRRPTFRRLLKTSGVKLENKLKNRQLKQQNVAKKQRKEQKKLRQAVKDANIRTPRPLETYRKRPAPSAPSEEEEDEEEFLDVLPTDMVEEEDQEQMSAMARQPSFITRDLSSCGPVHGGKRRIPEVVRSYEKVPRKMARTEEKEVIHLLPIKDRTGIIPQSVERGTVSHTPTQQGRKEPLLGGEEALQSCVPLTAEEREQLRVVKIKEKKEQIAGLASAVVSDPHSNMKCLKELRGMMMERDPCVAVTIRKLVMVSLMEIFKDIAPTYRIRPLTPAEMAVKVKKQTQQLRQFEEGLLSQYKFYLEDLEQTVKDWKQQKKKKRCQAVSLESYSSLAEVAVRCLCELLLTLPHFNFHNNIIVILAPLMNSPTPKVSALCCDAFRKLFQQDKVGVASLAAVRVISGLTKSLSYNVRPEVLRTLLSLRIKEVQMKKDLEDSKPQKKFMNNKEKKKNLSRMQRKWKKAEEKLEKELLEAEASENKDKKLKLHTEILNIIFLTYFILKKAQKSVLLPCCTGGTGKVFAHLINLEFSFALLSILHPARVCVQSGDLKNRESLHCIQTVFTILSGQGDVLNVDLRTFYSQLYQMLLQLHAGAPNDDVIIVLQCLDAMVTRRRKQVTLQRAMAFIKRLSVLSLHTLPNASAGLLSTTRHVLHAFPKSDFLLDNEVQGSGFYLPELDEPEHCNAQNTALWELHLLQRHYHPVVQQLAAHLSQGAPSEGSGALGVELSRRTPVELFNIYSVRDMSFNPPVAAAASRRKDRFLAGALLLDAELQSQAERVCVAMETELDVSSVYKNISS